MGFKLQCAIIDDEPLARECIANYIKEIDFLDLVGTGNNPLILPKIQEKHQLDLIFLDIQMPLMNGIEYLKLSKTRPMVILTTAYPHYALEGYELDVLDYLLKPITFTRFFKAVKKTLEFHKLSNQQADKELLLADTAPDYFFVKCDNAFEKIMVDEILFVEAMQNYVYFHTNDGKKYMALLPLKKVEESLPVNKFLRAHKSYLVAISQISAVVDNKLNIKSFQIPIGRNFKSQVMDIVVNQKLWKK